MSTAGVILCGGGSKRMGRPKAWLPFGAELMLPRIVRILSEVVQPIVVVAAADQDLPALPFGIAVVRDAQPDRGPLEGLACGLGSLHCVAEAAYVSSCDVPLLRPGFVRRMVDLLEAHAICVPRVDGRDHPLAAVYRTELFTSAQRLLEAGRVRPVFLFETSATRFVTPEELRDVDPDLDSLCNVNTLADYEAALRRVTDRG